MKELFLDLRSINEQARKHLEAGSKTESNRADRERISVVLNNVLATEIVCALRYKKAFLHGS